MFKKRVILISWCVLGLAIILLLISAAKQKEHKLCTNINIKIIGANKYVFVNENDTKEILKKNGADIGKYISEINLRTTENELQKNPWIKKADLFFDNNQILQVKINERNPLARVFTVSGNSFYIDSSGMRLPLSDLQTARVTVFTSFTSDSEKLSAPDSLLLKEVNKIAQFISQDTFWTYMISQVNITPQLTFELVPVLGNQIIELGDADNLSEKFNNLYSFYKEVWAKVGFEKYEKIDVQYKDQVVATIRNSHKPRIDSLKAIHFQDMVAKADSMNPVIVKDTITKKVSMRTVSAQTNKSATTKSKKINQKVKPKAIMEKRNSVAKN